MGSNLAAFYSCERPRPLPRLCECVCLKLLLQRPVHGICWGSWSWYDCWSLLAKGLADHDLFVINAGLVLIQQVVVAGLSSSSKWLLLAVLCLGHHETFSHALAKEIFHHLHDLVEGVQFLPDNLVPNFVMEGLVAACFAPNQSVVCALADLHLAFLLVHHPESNPSLSYRVVSIFPCCWHCCWTEPQQALLQFWTH